MARLARSAAALVATAGLLAGGAAPALAHTEVVRTAPKSGGTASTKITKVSVTFSQQIRRGTITVTGPGNAKVSKGKGGQDPRNVARLSVGVKSGLKAGTYRVRWSITAVDGHKQSGTFSFRLRKK